MVTNTQLKRSVAFATICSVLFLAGCQEEQQAQQAPPKAPTKVDVVTIKTESVEITESGAGRVTAYRTAEIRPQVSGIIQKRLFVEGSTVNEGDVLYQIDPAVYQAALASAKADLAVANANAASVKEQADRYSRLVKQSAVSKQEAADAVSAWKQAQAQILAAEAAVKTAQIDLNYTKITAPISGIVGRSAVTEGALVSAAQSTALATIRQISPVYVDMQRPATAVLKMKRSDAGQEIPVSLVLEDGAAYDEQGKLEFSEVSVDETTGTVNARARFENSQAMLLPGMYVRATIVTQTIEDAILAPQKGITRQPDGSTVALIVNADGVVATQKVEVGDAIRDQWFINSGLKPGDKVIVGGLQKVKAGDKVEMVESGAADSSNTQTQG
ncbi:efflux RND transporter periplasmic adaptor subunit [Neptunomonas sp. CHC150]|jgi:membrane fusion protein (multidrug efflux system)|uniref:efflux RND transporter periplasmic adaptor subunit n=1 Tax=Neptunomonas TaxID=75687 RepID=UPI0023F63661|nr:MULTISPECIES: efflux RND transporter periplasmic adaptor subunit [Neptunomonas]MDN2659335.1 efflux RND transporter periplasmic adaptor subunit [Neptunomonas sp. CHC150]